MHHARPQRTADVRVVVSKQKVTLDGATLSGTPMVSDVEAILGPSDRTWDTRGGANKVHTWDRLGVLVYEPYDGRCVSITLPFKPMSTSYSPKTLFGGSITVDGKHIGPTMTLPAIKRMPGAKQPYTNKSVVFDRGDFHVFTINERPGNTLDLVELSFWQRGRGDFKEKPKHLPRTVTSEPEEDCRDGDAPLCTYLALGYQTGATGLKSPTSAFELAQLACKGGDAFGCLMLGNMHAAGRGTSRSKPDALAAWQRACKLGLAPACQLH